MKALFAIFVAQICIMSSQAQRFTVSNDRLNIAYIGIDNPISITVENCPCNSIVVRSDNGTISGRNCRFIFRGAEIGAANITVYQKTATHLKKVGQYPLRVKSIPPPVFKIGPYGSNVGFQTEKKIQKVILAAQQFVRANFENLDICASYNIDSFFC